MPTDQSGLLVRLKALGYLELEDRHGKSLIRVLKRPKQAALFSVVALGDSAIRSRDRLMAMFWPESPASKARHSLSQLLYQIRQDMGDVIQRHGDHLVVDPALVWCDVAEFQTAAKEGRHADAAELYRGDLLEGLFLSDAPDFERWVDGERATLRRQAGGSLWAHAEELAARGALTEASTMARRAARLTPGEEATLQRLLGFLDGIGDRAGAVAAYGEFEAYLRAEYDVEPSPETVQLMEEIRGRDEALGEVRVRRPEVGGEERAPSGPGGGDEGQLSRMTPPPRLRPGRRAQVGLLTVGVVMCLWWIMTQKPSSTLRIGISIRTPDPERVDALRTVQSDLIESLARLQDVELASAVEEENEDLTTLVVLDARMERDTLWTGVTLIDPARQAIVTAGSFPAEPGSHRAVRFVRTSLGDWKRRILLEASAPTERSVELLHEASQLTREARAYHVRRLPIVAERFFAEADSTLRVALTQSRPWQDLHLARGWNALSHAAAAVERVQGGSTLADSLLQLAETEAETVLRMDSESAGAFELRGTVRLTKYQHEVQLRDSLRAASEADLLRAIDLNPGLGEAWTRLSRLRRLDGDLGGALLAIRRALEADPYLRSDLSTRRFLLTTAVYAGAQDEAVRTCAEGSRDFPADRNFRECRLRVLSWFPDVEPLDSAHAVFTRLDEPTPGPDRTRSLRLTFLAGALALGGDSEAAREALSERDRLERADDVLAADIEHIRVLTLLGDTLEALDRVERLIQLSPGVAEDLQRDPRTEGLRGNAAFRSLFPAQPSLSGN